MLLLVFSVRSSLYCYIFFFFFNDTATTEIYTLSLHDALPISAPPRLPETPPATASRSSAPRSGSTSIRPTPERSLHSRSEEHTSELQSRLHLVCRLLLEKKKKTKKLNTVYCTMLHHSPHHLDP